MSDDRSGDVVELTLASGASFFGEWARVPDALGAVVLLHDVGGDLDAVRPFAAQLAKLMLDCLLVDLPGHGISGGDWDRDGPAAVAEAIDHAATGQPAPPAVMALGGSANLVLAQPEPAVSALVTVGARLSPTDVGATSPWRVVPMLAIADPGDEAARVSQGLVQRWIRAWFVQMHLHYRDPVGAGEPWPLQAPVSTAAFVAEQIAYRRQAVNPGDGPTSSGSVGKELEERD